MVEMIHSPSTFKLGQQFNAFLFAPIGDCDIDGPVTVASALARLDIDPWREAAELALLCEDAAVRRLVSRLAEIPAETPPSDLWPIAVRLVALLPRRQATLESLRPRLPRILSSRQSLVIIAICVMALASVALNLSRLTGQHQAPASRQHAPRTGPLDPRP